MEIAKRTLLIGIGLVALVGLVAVSPATATVSDIDEDVVQCEEKGFDVAVIPYEDASSVDLWGNAAEYAEYSIDECSLDGRETTELAGELRAHVIGEPVPGDFGPGDTIDMAESPYDPQEDQYEWLMDPLGGIGYSVGDSTDS